MNDLHIRIVVCCYRGRFYRTYCIFRRIYIINNNCNFNL